MRDDLHGKPSHFRGPDEPKEITFELANGHKVKLAADEWHWRNFEEMVSGIQCEPYLSIRIYSDADVWPPRMVYLEEFCAGTDFQHYDFPGIWSWLESFCAGREVFEFDDLSEFLDFLADEITERSFVVEDAFGHYQRLPLLSDPEAFDQIDDSIFNDQNDNSLE